MALLIIAAGCRGKNEKPAGADITATGAQKQISQVKTQEKGEVLLIPNADGKTEIKDIIHGLGTHRTFAVEAQKGQTLKASVRAEPSLANIRVNQIISPSEELDGPFGQDMEYTLDESGRWKIVIGESNMQGDDYKGAFTLSIELVKSPSQK